MLFIITRVLEHNCKDLVQQHYILPPQSSTAICRICSSWDPNLPIDAQSLPKNSKEANLIWAKGCVPGSMVRATWKMRVLSRNQPYTGLQWLLLSGALRRYQTGSLVITKMLTSLSQMQAPVLVEIRETFIDGSSPLSPKVMIENTFIRNHYDECWFPVPSLRLPCGFPIDQDIPCGSLPGFHPQFSFCFKMVVPCHQGDLKRGTSIEPWLNIKIRKANDGQWGLIMVDEG